MKCTQKKNQKKQKQLQRRLDMADAHIHYHGAWADEHQQNNKTRGLISRAIIYRAY